MTATRYPHEGPTSGYRCPKCGSTSVECTAAAYEFSTLVCRACGYEDTMDDWQITEWIAKNE